MATATWAGLPGSAGPGPASVTSPPGCVTRCGAPNSGTSTPPSASLQPARAAQAAASAAAHSARAFASASANRRSGDCSMCAPPPVGAGRATPPAAPAQTVTRTLPQRRPRRPGGVFTSDPVKSRPTRTSGGTTYGQDHQARRALMEEDPALGDRHLCRPLHRDPVRPVRTQQPLQPAAGPTPSSGPTRRRGPSREPPATTATATGRSGGGRPTSRRSRGSSSTTWTTAVRVSTSPSTTACRR